MSLLRAGTGFLGLSFIVSLWASPDRLASLPWFIIAMVGVVLVLVVSGPLLSGVARRVRPTHLQAFFVGAAFVALGSALLTSRWPSYKLSWLNAVYAFLPSIRSLPFWWTQNGLQPNQTGAMLAVCTGLPVALALTPPDRGHAGNGRPDLPRGWWSGWSAWRWISMFLSIAGVMVVFMTGSRAAFAGLAVAILFVLILRTRRWLWAWGAGIVISGVGLYASGQLAALFHFFVHDESLDTKLVARLDIWSSALRGIQDHPLTGIGLGVFNEVMPARYPYQTVGLSYPVSQAHNLFLDVALSIGLLGTLGLAMLLLGCVLLAVRGLHLGSTSRLVSTGVLASITVFLVFGITDQISFSIPSSFIIWLWAIALVIVNERSRLDYAKAQWGTAKMLGSSLT
ncbi:MAG: O-antigen ligase family protein [Actinobacteria bacterium]|nr:O-antigen ligase family protein [Actinomycetota bacterium]